MFVGLSLKKNVFLIQNELRVLLEKKDVQPCPGENAGLSLLVFKVLHVVSEADRKSDPEELSEEKEVC